MTARRLLCLTTLAALALAAFAPTAPAAEQRPAAGGLVREGTVNQFDSINPFVAFNALPYVVFTNIYPTLVGYNTMFKIEGDWDSTRITSQVPSPGHPCGSACRSSPARSAKHRRD